MDLPDVCRIAIRPLVERALKDERENLLNEPPMSMFCLAQILYAASFEDKKRILRMIRTSSGMAEAGRLRSMFKRSVMIDAMAGSYIQNHPGCTVVELGCGFGTRYWRLAAGFFNYVEVDVPEIVDLKRALLKDFISYELIGSSVLDTAWMDAVAKRDRGNCLLIAEGLFSRATESDAVHVLRMVGDRFRRASIIFDTANGAYAESLLETLNARGDAPIPAAARGGARRSAQPGRSSSPGGTFRLVSAVRAGRSAMVLAIDTAG